VNDTQIGLIEDAVIGAASLLANALGPQYAEVAAAALRVAIKLVDSGHPAPATVVAAMYQAAAEASDAEDRRKFGAAGS
jgi:hypothetical protein